jgi:hypothetical protein
VKWLLANVTVGDEFDARDRAIAAGCECYIPIIKKVIRKHNGRSYTTVEKPAFPGYAFVSSVALREDVRKRLSFTYVKRGKDLCFVSDAIVDNIKKHEANNFAQSYYDSEEQVVANKSIRLSVNGMTIIIPLD